MKTMTEEQFITQLVYAVPEGSVFDNPGGGTSIIIKVGEGKLSYIRGSSRMYLSIDAIYDAWQSFSGKTTSSTDLKQHNPAVFDSKNGGHGCNCTTTFMVFEQMGLTDGTIQGSGRRGSPFFIVIR